MLNNEDMKSMTLDDIIVYLLDLKKKGIIVSYERDGHVLSSDTITWDSAYQEFYGMSKQEYDSKWVKEIIEKNRQQLSTEGVVNEG